MRLKDSLVANVSNTVATSAAGSLNLTGAISEDGGVTTMRRAAFAVLSLLSLYASVAAVTLQLLNIASIHQSRGFALPDRIYPYFRFGYTDFYVGDVGIKYGVMAFATAVPPIWWLTSHVRMVRLVKARRAAGQCVGCGYDLRAHNVGERCPECGTARKRVGTVNDSPPPPHEPTRPW